MISGERGHLTLEGEYDLSRQEEVATLFASCDDESPVVIDLTNVTYLDSTILRELIALRNRGAKRTITLIGVAPHIRRIFQIVNLDRIVEIRD